MGAFYLLLMLQIYVGPTDLQEPIWATAKSFDSSRVPFCRGFYMSSRYEANGGGYLTDYPGADVNFLVRLGELTKTRVGTHVVVKLDSPLINNCPLLYMSDAGTMSLSLAEVVGLRQYLLRGGFVWFDDQWGTEAWAQWLLNMKLVLPGASIFDLPNTHPIFHMQYNIDGIWQMPNNGLWLMDEQGHRITSERGTDSAEASMRGMHDPRGRLAVIVTHNTDVADGAESAEQAGNEEFFQAFSHKSYALFINVMLYVLSH